MESTFHTPEKSLINFYTLAVLLGLFCLFGVVATLSISDSTGMSSLYFLMLVQLLPFAICITTGKFNFLGFVMIVNFVSYSAAKYNHYVNLGSGTHLSEITIQAVEILTHCSVLTICAYYMTRLIIRVPVYSSNFKSFHLSMRQLVLIVLTLMFTFWISTWMPNSVIVLTKMFIGMTTILLLCSRINNSPRVELSVKIGTILFSLYTFIDIGSQEQMGYLIGTLFMLACLQRSYRNILPLVILMVAIVSIQTVKAPYRNMMKESGEGQSMQTKVGLLYNLLKDKFAGKQFIKSGSAAFPGALLDEATEEEIESLDMDGLNLVETEAEDAAGILATGFARAGDDSLERVLDWTPKKVPFWGGKTYANIPYMIIPRFIWPDKPTWSQWNEFGRIYGILGPNDYETSVGVSYLGEAYMNFGFTGMYLMAIFFGIMIVGVERISYSYLKGPYTFTFICFLFPLVNSASNLGPIINSIVLTVVGVYIFRKYIQKIAKRDHYAEAMGSN